MAPRKIIFFVVVGLVSLVLVVAILLLQKKTNTPSIAPKEIKIWITSWSAEWYESIVEWFKWAFPEYKNTNIVFEKKTTDPIRYRTLLLTTLADGNWPDIFMLEAWADDVLASKIEPIPSDIIDISYFERNYDDIFLPLIVSSGSRNTITKSLLGVPLGFEVMWIFYNKNLVRTIPKTWNELDILYRNWIAEDVFVSSLWMGPRYTPNASDILWLFYGKAGVVSTRNLRSGSTWWLGKYLAYRDYTIGSRDDVYSPIMTLAWQQEIMEKEKKTTFDLFMEWKVAIILWFPSIIRELEKSDKRAGMRSKSSEILTERMFQETSWRTYKNIARFDFFGISKSTSSPRASADFLIYLMTEDAQKRFLQHNTEYIAAQRAYWTAQKNKNLSDILSRTTIDAFIPDINTELFIFSYWLKAEFWSLLSENIDRIGNLDINNISDALSRWISCEIDIYNGKNVAPDCEKR